MRVYKTTVQVGAVYSRLTVLERAGTTPDGKVTVRCRCECGNEVVVPWTNVKLGRNKSCGCLLYERQGDAWKRMIPWERLQNNSVPEPNTGCWLWLGFIDPCGYGRFKYKGERRAHRCSWMIANERPIPDGMIVMHKCDNPACVNPDHLVLGTIADNTHDMDSKGRGVTVTADDHYARREPQRLARGSRHGRAKLDEDKVRFIRLCCFNGQSQSKMARRFSVTEALVSQIVKHRIWTHV
jgi:hypothetical protein